MTNPRPYHLATSRTSACVRRGFAPAGQVALAAAARWQGSLNGAGFEGFCLISKDTTPGVLPT